MKRRDFDSDLSFNNFKSHLMGSNTVTALPRLTAEWNMNRYFDPTATNFPSEDTDGYDIDIFPIESIVEPLRPTKGANKAITNLSIASDEFADENSPRFYLSDEDDKYKYWLSPNRSDASGNLVGCQPQVEYSEVVKVNKIVIKLEDTWARPADFTIQTSVIGDSNPANWSTVATNPVIAPNGQITLYWNGTGWNSNKPLPHLPLPAPREIKFLRMTVTRLTGGRRKDDTPTFYRIWDRSHTTYVEHPTNGGNSYLSLIEMSARLEVDLTDRLIEVNDSFNAGDSSMITPIGTISSNVANLTLWNADNLFNSDNPDSPYNKLMEPNVEMNLQYIYDVGGVPYVVQQFRMYVERWAGQANENLVVDLTDYSKFLKEMTPPPMMYEDVALPEIMYRLCDAVGFSDYKIAVSDDVAHFTIPVWYCDGEATVWEVLDEMATATQSLIYFDGYGILNVKTREAAFPTNNPDIDWTLRSQKRGAILPDIVSMELSEFYESNVVKVVYKATKWSKWNNGQPAMEVVWEPENVIALRANDLLNDIPASGLVNIKISPKDLRIWPYEGMVNIEGELFKYKGKEFIYYTGSTGQTRNKRTIDSIDEHKKWNAKTPSQFRYKNHFTGDLVVVERGVWNTHERAHSNKPLEYDVRRFVNGERVDSKRGYERGRSTVTLSSEGKLKDPGDRLYMTTGSSQVVGDYKMYGFRVRFDSGEAYTDQIAGLVFHNQGANEHGYHVELTPSSKITAKNIKTKKELTFYSRNGNDGGPTKNKNQGKGTHHMVAEDKDDKKGKKKKNKDKDKKRRKDRDGFENSRVAIGKKIEYDVDVTFTATNDNNHVVRVYVNGKKEITEVVAGADKISRTTKFGLYIRGRTKATFEYLYAVREHAKFKEPADDTSYLDKIRGSYYGTYADRELAFNYNTSSRTLKKKSTKRKNNKPNFFFDDFGAVVHEVREYDVTFSKTPILHSRLFNTNDWSSIVTEYRASAFGAHFVVANTTRQNAIVNGEETYNQGGGNQSVNHRLNVIGRPLVEAEENSEEEVRNEEQIRSRGEIETQIESRWIQNRDAAESLATWVSEHWSTGCEEYTVEVFGNPLIEVGDVVAIDYEQKDITPEESHFFVTGVSTAFVNGVTTSLTLRRAPRV